MKKKIKTIMILLTVSFILLAILFRLQYFNTEFGDQNFINWWFDYFHQEGFKGLGHYPFDYAPLYITFVALFSYLPFRPVLIIKCFSYLFEILLAILVYKYLSSVNKKDKKEFNILLSTIVLLIPTVIYNSSWWCQCDIIYSFFVVLSLYFYNKNYTNKSFIALGLAFSFKLQFIFILPVFIILFFRDKKIKWYQFLYIPLVNLVVSIPSFICGYSLQDLLNVYVTQTSEYSDYLSLYVNNIYTLFDFNKLFGNKTVIIMSCFTVMIFVGLLVYCILKKIKFNNKNILQLSLLSILICVFFLPCMHERYLFMADVISVIYVLIYRKGYIQTILINSISLLSYIYFIYGIKTFPNMIITIMFILVIINQFMMFNNTSLKR